MKTPKILVSVAVLAGLAATGWAPAALAAEEVSVTLLRSVVPGGGLVKGILGLPQPSAGANYRIDFQGTAQVVPSAEVTISRGQNSGDFAVSAGSVGIGVDFDIHVCLRQGTICSRVAARVGRLRVVPGILQSLTLDRTNVVGGAHGQTVTGTVTLEEPAQPEPVRVLLSQSLPLDVNPPEQCGPIAARLDKYSVPVSVPTQFNIRGGERTGQFQVTTFLLADSAPTRQITLTASLQGEAKTRTATLTIRHWRATSLVLTPATLLISKSAPRPGTNATLTMNAAAPLNVKVNLGGTSALDYASPGEVTLAQGSSTVSFPISGIMNAPASCQDIPVAVAVTCAREPHASAYLTLCPAP